MDMDWPSVVYGMLCEGDSHSSENVRYAKDKNGVMFIAKYDIIGNTGHDSVEYHALYVVITSIDGILKVDYACSREYFNTYETKQLIDHDFDAFMDSYEHFID